MNKQEQIEEMANYYCEYCKKQTGKKFCEHIDDKSCNIFFEAELFYNAGYRKVGEAEIERLKADNQVLIEALQYMAGMYGFRPSITKLDNEIEYSCNHYVTDKETWLVLKKAEKIIDWWE